MEKGIKKLEFALCAALVLFQLYTAYFGNLFGIAQKAVHIGLVISIIALNQYLKSGDKKLSGVRKTLSLLIFVFGLFLAVYLCSIARILSVDMTTFTPLMKVTGIIFLAILIYYCWTNVGPLMSAVVRPRLPLCPRRCLARFRVPPLPTWSARVRLQSR